MKKNQYIKRILCLLISVVLIAGVFGCKKKIEYSKTEFFSMNTFISISADASPEVVAEVEREIYAIEKQLSATDDRSDISNIYGGDSKTYQNTMELLRRAHEIALATDGAFDYTLGELIKLWNVTGDEPNVPTQSEIDGALLICGFEKADVSKEVFQSDAAVSVDLGAIAKGYAGDRAAKLLRSKGVEHASLWLGGNVTVIGSSPKNRAGGKSGWDVAINNPFDTAALLGTINLTDATVSVSGSYERFFEKDGVVYHHILDRKSGYPADSGLVSCAVICDDGTLADALSTALFVMGHEKAMEFYNSGVYDFEAVFCTDDGRVFVTDGIKDKFNPDYSARHSSGDAISFENVIA